jgi:hypothetical protein
MVRNGNLNIWRKPDSVRRWPITTSVICDIKVSNSHLEDSLSMNRIIVNAFMRRFICTPRQPPRVPGRSLAPP